MLRYDDLYVPTCSFSGGRLQYVKIIRLLTYLLTYLCANCVYKHCSDQESSCDFIGFDQAVNILRAELNYPEERALHFVKRFDHNKDGKLSVAEFRQFKGKIEETCVSASDSLRLQPTSLHLSD